MCLAGKKSVFVLTLRISPVLGGFELAIAVQDVDPSSEHGWQEGSAFRRTVKADKDRRCARKVGG